MSNLGCNVNRKMRVGVGVANSPFSRRCWYEMVKKDSTVDGECQYDLESCNRKGKRMFVSLTELWRRGGDELYQIAAGFNGK